MTGPKDMARAGLARPLRPQQPDSPGAAPARIDVPAATSAKCLARVACLPGQRRFWVLDQLDPGNPALNIAARWRLQGRVSSTELDIAFARIVARHQSLRMYIAEEDGEPMQIIVPSLSLHIPDIDLTALAEEEAFAEAERIAQLEARAPFDLSAPPLIRVTHLRVRDTVSIVLVTAHHLACDAWSVGVLAREMGTICAALNMGQAPELPALPISYSEYSARRGQPAIATQRRDEEFWKRSLRDLRHFELHPDHPRPPLQTSNGARVSRLLDRDVCAGLHDVSRRGDCTLFMTVLTALFTLLHRYSGETDIAIGSPVSGRDEAGLEGLVGLLTDTIVLRGVIEGDPVFTDLLARVRDSVVESFGHLSTPLNRVIEMLKPNRDLSRNALFSVNFDFQQAFVNSGHYGSFRLADLPACPAGVLYDLNFSMGEGADGWRLACEYNTDLFEPETAGRMLDHFANLLRAVAADPAQTILSMPMLDEAERHTLVVDWNQTAAAYPQQMTFPRLFADQVRRTPDAVALVCGERQMSYHELDRASNRLAQHLHSRGIARASRVGICLDRSPDLVVALLAVFKAGGAYVPLDPRYPAARLAQIVEDAQPAAVLTTLALRECLSASGALPQEKMILLDADAAAIRRQRDAPLAPAAGTGPADLAYVIYTSGSTGRPKGVQIQHRALTNLLWSLRTQPGLTADDTLVSVTTISFDMSVLDMFLPLIVGARLVVAQEPETTDGDALLRLLRRHRSTTGATVLQATPVTWQILLAAGWRADPPLKMLCGGEALSRTLADQLLLHGGELWNLYGPTETTVYSSVLRVEPGPGPVPIGPPIANTQLYVLDSHRQLVPMGAPGELFIGGDGVAPGYLNLPSMTRERFVADPFSKLTGATPGPTPGPTMYRTGDLVRRRQRDRIEYLGRNDHQIKLRGFRIELGEIESVLRAHPLVSDCVAVAGPDASGESAIRAYVVARTAQPEQLEHSGHSGQPSAQLVSSLQTRLRQALPAYMCPSFIVVLEALPRTPNGKIDRASLPMPAPMQGEAHEPEQPVNDAERRLATIWSAVLGRGNVATDANFFEVGGHSLLAVKLLARIATEFGQTLSLAALFKHATIAEQAKLLALMEGGAKRGSPRASFDFRQVVTLQPNGSRPPLIGINNTGIYYALSKRLGQDQPFTSLQLFDPSSPHAALPQTLEEIAAGYAQLIRRVQPIGPYALLGWCVAGTLAFEVARQLSAGGETVSQLILFDTLAPGYLQRLPRHKAVLADYSYRLQLIYADWARVQWSRHRFAEFLAHRTIVKKLMRWYGRQPAEDNNDPPMNDLGQGHSLSPEQYDQWLLQYLQASADAYDPKPYSGTMTLFRSSAEPSGRFLDPQMGWGDFVEGGVEVVVIDGDHFSIFQEPRVSQMAQRIESAADASLR